MINNSVLRIITAKGAGDSLLRKINESIQNGLQYSLQDVCDSKPLMKYLGIADGVAQYIYNGKDTALRLEEDLYNNEVGMCWIGDEDYPEGIKKLKKGTIPAVLFFKGNYELIKQQCIGFTGSRQVSDAGIGITEASAKQLSKKKITIVSGYAKGVDITAHKTALMEGGNTIFVIVEGILKNRVKREVKELLTDKNHLFISQFLPHCSWCATNAMKRNNTIIGLSDVMILIESAMKGGTFDAGQQSLKNKKPLFVVEYATEKPSAEGNSYFIRNGGIPLRKDKTGNPVLKRVYSYLEKECTNSPYEQLKLNI